MRLATYDDNGDWRPALSHDGTLFDLDAVARLSKLSGEKLARGHRDLLAMPRECLHQLQETLLQSAEALAAEDTARPVASVRLGPPIPEPQKIICIGLNYHDHAEEVGATPPNEPIFFAKYANSLIGARDNIIPPGHTSKVDYEAELAVVIGKTGRDIPERDALDHIAGAMSFNDVSARDLQLANQLWTGGKAIDTFGPCGPEIVLMDEIADLQDLTVQTWLNGDLLQNGSTRSMIFSVAELIAFLSRIMTLVPGDIIVTGTPAGVAASHTPSRFMSPGDTVEVEIEGLGRLHNRIAEPWS